jgi:hypothetical protein
MLFASKDDGKLYAFDPAGAVPYTYFWKSKLFQLPSASNFGCFRIESSEISTTESAQNALIAAQNAVITAANAAIYAGGLLQSQLNGNYLNELSLNGSTMQDLIPQASNSVGVTVYAGREPVLAGDFEINRVYRLPSGFRAVSWEISVTGQKEVYAVEMATDPTELGIAA